jgi:signal peptidase
MIIGATNKEFNFTFGMDFKEINYKKIKKLLSWTAIGFLFTVLVFVLIPLLPVENNYSLKMVLSGSMSPTIKTGAVIIVKPVSDYQIGDVVTYKYGTRDRDLTTHRIVGQEGNEFITKGDNNNADDIYPIKKEQIIGKVVFDIPYAGYITNIISSKIGILILILVPALLIIIGEGRKIFNETQKMRKKKRNEMNKKSGLGNGMLNLFIFLLLSAMPILFASPTNTYAFFSDTAVSINQSFVAGYWVPVLDPIGDKSGTEGQILQFTISATDPNGDPLTYSANNLPTNATFIGQTFSWTPLLGDAEIYSNVLFEVSDGRDSVSENINIVIAKAPLVQISNITIEDIATSSAIISWQTSESVASSVVVYGLMEDDYANTSSGTILTGDFYSVQLESLSADIPYYFKIKIIDNLEREVFSDENTFTTSLE